MLGKDAEPYVALEKLLEVRADMVRGALGQREVVRLRPDLHKQYPPGPLREQFGDGSMADDLLAQADRMDELVYGLDRASAYYWTDAMSGLLVDAATRMPRYTFTESSFPTPNGFVWHTSPQTIGNIEPEGELSSDDQANLFKEPLPLQAWAWRRDHSDGTVECISWRWTRGSRREHDEWLRHRNFRLRFGMTLEEVVAHTEGRDWKAFGKIVACALALMEQKLLVPGRAHVGRTLTKRYQHSVQTTDQPNVRIVELRRREVLPTSVTTDEPKSVEWHHRWFVRAHWRQQRHPSTGAYKPVLVHAYIKGPEGRPLKPPRQTIFSVDR